MSVLLGHAKAMRALADALCNEAAQLRSDDNAGWSLLYSMGLAHAAAAETLTEQARAECSGKGDR